MKTFNMTIIRDRAKPWQEDIQEITDKMKKRGQYPQGYERDDNFFRIFGNYACTCHYQHDKAYCDEDCRHAD